MWCFRSEGGPGRLAEGRPRLLTLAVIGITTGISATSSIARGDDLPGRFAGIRPLGPPVQSDAHEIQAVESSGGRRLFFASSRLGLGRFDIWEAVAEKSGDPFSKVRNVGELNSPEGDFPTYATSDALVLYFQSNRDSGGPHDQFVAWRSNVADPFRWRALDEINTEEHHEGGASATADGRILVFVSDRPGGRGQKDLWIVTRESGDDPERPFEPGTLRNLGDLNSETDDVFPSISADGRTLFWTDQWSVRPHGKGLADVWYATRPDAGSPFGPATNLEGLNSADAEVFFRISNLWPRDSRVYFSRCSPSACATNTDLFAARWIPDRRFRRGDSNADTRVDIADAIGTLNALFLGGPAAPCADAADANDDGTVDIADAVATLGHLFGGAPAFESDACAADPTGDTLDCGSYPPCLDG